MCPINNPSEFLDLVLDGLKMRRVDVGCLTQDESNAAAANFESLACVRKLSLISCFSLIDVSWLANLHSLNLFHCYKVVDVSVLKAVPILAFDRRCECTGWARLQSEEADLSELPKDT